MNPRVVLALAGGLLLIATARWSAAHWLVLAAGGVGLAAAGLVLWHRRRVAELHELHNVIVGRYRRTGFAAWPKACQDCGAQVPDWRAVRAHDDAGTSACAAFTDNLDRLARAPKEPVGTSPWAYDDAPKATDKDRV